MKLQWWSSSWNPLQYKIYNTVSIHTIAIHILHSYMHLAVQHLHCVALLINGQCLVNASEVDWVRLPNYWMLKGKESAYKSRQRVGGASEIIVNTHPRNTCWRRKWYWNVEPVWWCYLKLPHLAWVRLNTFQEGWGCTSVVHWEMNPHKLNQPLGLCQYRVCQVRTCLLGN